MYGYDLSASKYQAQDAFSVLGMIVVEFVPTKDNVADIMTKVLDVASFLKHKLKLVL